MGQAPYSYRLDPKVPSFPDDRPIFVFDGECVLCSRAAKFVLIHGRRRGIRLAIAQSPLGEALYEHYRLKSGDYDTNLLMEEGWVRTQSDASLRVYELAGFPWSLAGVLRIVPSPLLDFAYRWVARNRLRIFGRRDSCFVPNASDRARFL